MKYSVQHMNNDVYKITITSSSDYDKEILEGPISKAKKFVYQYFDQALKQNLGENAYITWIVNDNNLPNEVQVQVVVKEVGNE